MASMASSTDKSIAKHVKGLEASIEGRSIEIVNNTSREGIYNPGQNSLAKHILFSFFSKYSHLCTFYKMLGTLIPPPTSMLLYLVKPLRVNMFICADNIDIGGRGVIWHFCHIFCP